MIKRVCLCKLATIAMALLVGGCAAKDTFVLPSSSMEPTIPAGSTVIVDYAAYKESNPKRFDIVVFHPPPAADAPRESLFAFRVFGLPGERIEIVGNQIAVNGNLLTFPEKILFLSHLNYGEDRIISDLSDGEFFVLGDNIAKAYDSRIWGPVSRDNILGKVRGIAKGGRGQPSN